MQNFSQTEEFLYFCLVGILVNFIFDIFRFIRKNFKTPDYITYIEDIIFLVISTIIVMFALWKISNGILRFYIFLAIFLGIIIYSLTFSKFCIIIINSIVVFCKKMSLFVKKVLNKLIFFLKKLGKKIKL